MGNKNHHNHTLQNKKSMTVQHLKEQPHDLIMYKPLQKVKKFFYIPKKYLWLEDQATTIQMNNNLQDLKNFNEYYDTQYCKSINQVLQFTNINPNQLYRLVISNNSQIQELCQKFQMNSKVTHIYIINKKKSISDNIKEKFKKIKYICNNGSKLMEKILEQSKQQNKYKIIPYFAKSNWYQNSIDNYRYNFYGLTLMNNRTQAKQDFVKLAQFIYHDQKYVNINNFIKNYPVQFNAEIPIIWYNKQTFFYKLINNLLRSSDDPLETVYLRLPVIDLFNSIRINYKFQTQKALQIYRGGKIDQQQLNFIKQNEGGLIQMVGFMTALRDRKKAESFAYNILFIIQIPDSKRSDLVDYGYVDISKINNQNEKQFLINSLNVFKVIKIELRDGLNIVRLKYGQLAQLFAKLQEKIQLTAEQMLQINNYKYKIEKIEKNIKTQGDVLYYCQQYQDTIKYYKKFDQILKDPKIDQEDTAKIYHQLGRCYQSIKQFNISLDYSQKSLQIQMKISDQNNLRIASTYCNIAHIMKGKGNFKQALQYQHKSLIIQKKLLGQYHSQISRSYHNIAELQLYNQQNDKALEYYLKYIDVQKKLKGQNHLTIANSYNYIASIYDSKGLTNEALQYYLKCLEIQLKILGENHFTLANTFNSIGVIYDAQNNTQKALQYYHKCLIIYIKTMGENNSTTASSYNNIAGLYYSNKDYLRAEEYYLKCLNIKIKTLGQFNNSTALTYSNLGVVYTNIKKYNQGFEHFKKAFQIWSKVIGSNNEKTRQALANMQFCEIQKGKILQTSI